jgi:AcrR family transcriptional regulator
MCHDGSVTSLRAYGGVAGDQRRAERRARLFEAGYDLIAEGGTDAVTVIGVCRRAGLTARYFYEHFKSREELLNAIFDAEAATVIGLITDAAVAAPDDPQVRGEAAVRALLDALEADPRRAILSSRSTVDTVLLRSRAHISAQLSQALVDSAHLVWPGAATHPERVPLAATLTVGGVVEMVVEWASGQSPLSRDEVITLCSRFMIATGEVVLVTATRA